MQVVRNLNTLGENSTCVTSWLGVAAPDCTTFVHIREKSPSMLLEQIKLTVPQYRSLPDTLPSALSRGSVNCDVQDAEAACTGLLELW